MSILSIWAEDGSTLLLPAAQTLCALEPQASQHGKQLLDQPVLQVGQACACSECKYPANLGKKTKQKQIRHIVNILDIVFVWITFIDVHVLT